MSSSNEFNFDHIANTNISIVNLLRRLSSSLLPSERLLAEQIDQLIPAPREAAPAVVLQARRNGLFDILYEKAQSYVDNIAAPSSDWESIAEKSSTQANFR